MSEKRILWMGNSPGGNYTEIVTRLNLLPGMYDVNVFHDDNCAILNDEPSPPPCNCNAEVTIVRKD